MPTNSRRSSTQAFPHAGHPQYYSQCPTKDKAAHKVPEIPLLPQFPAFTVLSAHENKTNVRALAQCSGYVAAQSKAQEPEAMMGDDVQPVGNVDIIPALDSGEHQIVAEDRDLDAAGILVEVAKKQRFTSVATDAEIIPVDSDSEPEANASMEISQWCPVTTCLYHRVRLFSKAEKAKHTMTHFEGGLTCGYKFCDFLSDFRNVENTEEWFCRLQTLRSHVQDSHLLNNDGFKCNLCFRDLNQTDYLKHLDDCILRTVELQTSGKAEGGATLSCENHGKDIPEASRPGLSLAAFEPFSGPSNNSGTGMLSRPPDILSEAFGPYTKYSTSSSTGMTSTQLLEASNPFGQSPPSISEGWPMTTPEEATQEYRICGKELKRSRNWKAHMKTHDPEREYAHLVRSNTPQLDRTTSDSYQDELYNPSAPSSIPRQQAQGNTVSSHRNAFSNLLQVANTNHINGRSASPVVNISPQRSPFRESSRYNPSSPAYVTRLTSPAQLRQQQKLEAEAHAYAQHHPPSQGEYLNPAKTISPKEALLDYDNTEDKAKMLLFSPIKHQPAVKDLNANIAMKCGVDAGHVTRT